MSAITGPYTKVTPRYLQQNTNLQKSQIPSDNWISSVIGSKPSQETSTNHACTAHRIPGNKKKKVQYTKYRWLCAVQFTSAIISRWVFQEIKNAHHATSHPDEHLFSRWGVNTKGLHKQPDLVLWYLQRQPMFDAISSHMTCTVHVIFFIEHVVSQRWSSRRVPKSNNQITICDKLLNS